MYTMRNTLDEIMQSNVADQVKMLMGKVMFMGCSVLDLLPEEAHSQTLETIHQTFKTPWGMPFPADEIMLAANLAEEVFVEEKWEVRGLWTNETPVFDGTKREVCLFTPKLSDGENRPAVIICPGGAYQTVALVNEGFATAKALAAHGCRPYILRYRVEPTPLPEPQKDLVLAVLHVRANAKTDGINPDNLMIMGFSAGGHLCASTVTRCEEMRQKVLEELEDRFFAELYRGQRAMPDKLCLGYAVTTFEKELCEQLPGICDESERLAYSVPTSVTAEVPKTYLWACEDDDLVSYRHSILMQEALQAAGVPNRCRIFPTGGHGIALGIGTSAEGWLEDMLNYMTHDLA